MRMHTGAHTHTCTHAHTHTHAHDGDRGTARGCGKRGDGHGPVSGLACKLPEDVGQLLAHGSQQGLVDLHVDVDGIRAERGFVRGVDRAVQRRAGRERRGARARAAAEHAEIVHLAAQAPGLPLQGTLWAEG